MAVVVENPWSGEALEDYVYYCCPECSYKAKFKHSFIEHAVDQHPNSDNFVQKINKDNENFILVGDKSDVTVPPIQQRKIVNQAENSSRGRKRKIPERFSDFVDTEHVFSKPVQQVLVKTRNSESGIVNKKKIEYNSKSSSRKSLKYLGSCIVDGALESDDDRLESLLDDYLYDQDPDFDPLDDEEIKTDEDDDEEQEPLKEITNDKRAKNSKKNGKIMMSEKYNHIISANQECAYCHKMLTTKKLRLSHENQHHVDSQGKLLPISCSICNQTSSNSITLRTHMIVEHDLSRTVKKTYTKKDRKKPDSKKIIPHEKISDPSTNPNSMVNLNQSSVDENFLVLSFEGDAMESQEIISFETAEDGKVIELFEATLNNQVAIAEPVIFENDEKVLAFDEPREDILQTSIMLANILDPVESNELISVKSDRKENVNKGQPNTSQNMPHERKQKTKQSPSTMDSCDLTDFNQDGSLKETFVEAPENIIEHDYHQAKIEIYKCAYCPKGFVSEDWRTLHEHKNHASFGVLNEVICNLCYIRCKTSMVLRKHYMSEHKLSKEHNFAVTTSPGAKPPKYNPITPSTDIDPETGLPYYKMAKKHKCSLCQKKFVWFDEMKEHIILNHQNSEGNVITVSCFMCNKDFLDPFNVPFDKTCSSCQKIKFRCAYCSEKFPAKELRHLHESMVHVDDNSVMLNVTCHRCQNICANGLEYRKHYKEKHSDKAEEEFDFKCIKCNNKPFSNVSYLRKHAKAFHSQDGKIFHCDIEGCEYSTKYQNSIGKHKISNHIEKNFKCEHCNMMFSLEERLTKHYEHCRIKNQFNYQCPTCSKYFHIWNSMALHHQKVHKSLPPDYVRKSKAEFECPHCSLVLFEKGVFSDHITKYCTGAAKKYDFKTSCNFCDQEFNFPKFIWHYKHVHDKTPPGYEDKEQFECERCDSTYFTSRALEAHVKKDHRNMNIEQCPHCKKMFKAGNNLNRHIDGKHFGIKKYTCQFCPMKFAFSYTKVFHERYKCPIIHGPKVKKKRTSKEKKEGH